MKTKAFALLLALLLMILPLCACDGEANESENDAQKTEEVGDKNNYIRVKIKSNSMEPTLRQGKSYNFKPVEDASTLAVNDIVLVESKVIDERIARRIVAFKDEDGKRRFVLKGDANAIEDADPYYAEDILGVWRP